MQGSHSRKGARSAKPDLAFRFGSRFTDDYVPFGHKAVAAKLMMECGREFESMAGRCGKLDGEFKLAR